MIINNNYDSYLIKHCPSNYRFRFSNNIATYGRHNLYTVNSGLSATNAEKISVMKISKIKVKSKAWVVAHLILDANDNKLYESGDFLLGQSKTLELKNLGIQPGIQFILIGFVKAGFDCWTNEIFEYDPNSNTVVEYKLSGSTFTAKFTKI